MLIVEFTVIGIPCLGLNGGPTFKHSEAFSFLVATADRAETDRYSSAIIESGGQRARTAPAKTNGACHGDFAARPDKRRLRPRSRRRPRAFEAMMPMKKIDIAKNEAACRG